MRARKRSHNTPLALAGLGTLAVLASVSGGSSRPVDAATVDASSELAVPLGDDAAEGIRSVDFADVAQPGSACSDGLRFTPPGKIPVAEGSSQVLDLGQLTQLQVDAAVAYGDVDGDGAEDAVVHVICSYGANGAAHSVHVWSLDGDRLRHVAGLDEAPGEGELAPAVQEVAVEDGAVNVVWSHYAEGDSNCCPSGQTSVTYELADDELEAVGRPVTSSVES